MKTLRPSYFLLIGALFSLQLFLGCNAGFYYKPTVSSFYERLPEVDTLSLSLSGVELWITSQEGPSSVLIQTPKKKKSKRSKSTSESHYHLSVQSQAKEKDRMEVNLSFPTVLKLTVRDSEVYAGSLSSPMTLHAAHSTLRLKDLSHSFDVVGTDSSELIFSVRQMEIQGTVSGDFTSVRYVQQGQNDSLKTTPTSSTIIGETYSIQLNLPAERIERTAVGTIW